MTAIGLLLAAGSILLAATGHSALALLFAVVAGIVGLVVLFDTVTGAEERREARRRNGR